MFLLSHLKVEYNQRVGGGGMKIMEENHIPTQGSKVTVLTEIKLPCNGVAHKTDRLSGILTREGAFIAILNSWTTPC